jgi:hypothetical protein
MERLNHFEVVECTAYYRPVGKVSFPEVSAMLGAALSVCHENGIPKLLCDVTGLKGFGVPNIVHRFWFAQQLARDAKGVVVAIVAPKRMIDPKRFGTTVARNRGATADIFSSESDARDWLLGVPERLGANR